MKTFAFIRNYGAALTEEMAGRSPWGEGRPGWFTLPDSTLIKGPNPVFVPDFADDFRIFPSVAFRIGRLGKGMAARFADRYIESIGLAALMMSPGQLNALRAQGLPWDEALAFDKSLMLGDFLSKDKWKEEAIEIRLGEDTMVYDPKEIREDFAQLLERLGRTHTLKNGDLVLAALHPHGLEARVPDSKQTPNRLTARFVTDNNDNTTLIDFNIR